MREHIRTILVFPVRVFRRLFRLLKANRLWIIIALLLWIGKPVHDAAMVWKQAGQELKDTAEWQATTARQLEHVFWLQAMGIAKIGEATDMNTLRLDKIMKSRGMEPVFDPPLLEGWAPYEEDE